MHIGIFHEIVVFFIGVPNVVFWLRGFKLCLFRIFISFSLFYSFNLILLLKTSKPIRHFKKIWRKIHILHPKFWLIKLVVNMLHSFIKVINLILLYLSSSTINYKKLNRCKVLAFWLKDLKILLFILNEVLHLTFLASHYSFIQVIRFINSKAD